MAEASSLIPKAGVIEVPNPPDITGAQFLKQAIEYLNLQISPLDEEVSKASSGDNGLVSTFVFIIYPWTHLGIICRHLFRRELYLTVYMKSSLVQSKQT
ncbi:hypothetical protein EON65_09965 [archaeon]|nr:MAG: hypothetical protein EON65_09965 [archaeon]